MARCSACRLSALSAQSCRVDTGSRARRRRCRTNRAGISWVFGSPRGSTRRPRRTPPSSRRWIRQSHCRTSPLDTAAASRPRSSCPAGMRPRLRGVRQRTERRNPPRRAAAGPRRADKTCCRSAGRARPTPTARPGRKRTRPYIYRHIHRRSSPRTCPLGTIDTQSRPATARPSRGPGHTPAFGQHTSRRRCNTPRHTSGPARLGYTRPAARRSRSSPPRAGPANATRRPHQRQGRSRRMPRAARRARSRRGKK